MTDAWAVIARPADHARSQRARSSLVMVACSRGVCRCPVRARRVPFDGEAILTSEAHGGRQVPQLVEEIRHLPLVMVWTLHSVS